MGKIYTMFLGFLGEINHNLLTFIVCLGITIPSLSLAETQISANSLSNSFPVSWEFSPPDTGQPNRREGGATRGPLANKTNCLVDDDNFTALVPQSGKGLTAQAYPTFSWYLPPNLGKKLRFSLKNKEGDEIYSQEYFLIKNQLTPQIMSLKLPDNLGLAPLELGQEYHWQLALICNTSNDLDFISVQGMVERVSPHSLSSVKLDQLNLENQIKIYAQERLWYETFDLMLKLQRLQPSSPELKSAWVSLLHSVGLDNISHVK
jgi:hypothetical protein